MSRLEIIEEIKKLPAEEQRRVVEAAIRLLGDKDTADVREKRRRELKEKMRLSAERLREFYKPGSEHLVGECLDEKDFHDPR